MVHIIRSDEFNDNEDEQKIVSLEEYNKFMELAAKMGIAAITLNYIIFIKWDV